jgi:signal peptidase I
MMKKRALGEKKDKKFIREYLELIIETAVFVLFVMTFVVQAFQIPTGSMEPNLLVGDFLLVNKMEYRNSDNDIDKLALPKRPVRRRDIIVFKYPNSLTKDYVKRAIGLPGDEIEIKRKQVFVNGSPIEEPYKRHVDPRTYNPADDSQRDNFGPITVPHDSIFAMGDNRDNSEDSRYWGFVPMSHLKGRPWIVYFSYAAENGSYLKTGLADRLKKLVGLVTRTRINRILKIVR